MNQIDWSKYKLRHCHSMHQCKLCDESIRLGQPYRDGGHGRRAHEACVAKTMAIDVKGMTTVYLKANGFDGLLRVDGSCGCQLSDLMPCIREPTEECEAAHKIQCPGLEDDDDIGDGVWGSEWCEGECEWHMKAGPRPHWSKGES